MAKNRTSSTSYNLRSGYRRTYRRSLYNIDTANRLELTLVRWYIIQPPPAPHTDPLQLDPGALSSVLEAAGADCQWSTARLNSPPQGAREVAVAAGFLCKKCRLSFTREAAIGNHGCGQSPGGVRMVRLRAGCKNCEAVFESAQDYRRHVEAAHPEPALSPRLSVEMEDVVNQITALAAQALKPDPNANIFLPVPPATGQ
ncbi:unnamed protein product [Nezara viridula]|uniref:C2H2-type domain-containing protein n=1 Tax=Nezara viridula TaxID=85310 RepID=A0A9P0HAH9_NEZVI|nr:unnamed protein product [Nezara viridula]